MQVNLWGPHGRIFEIAIELKKVSLNTFFFKLPVYSSKDGAHPDSSWGVLGSQLIGVHTGGLYKYLLYEGMEDDMGTGAVKILKSSSV